MSGEINEGVGGVGGRGVADPRAHPRGLVGGEQGADDAGAEPARGPRDEDGLGGRGGGRGRGGGAWRLVERGQLETRKFKRRRELEEGLSAHRDGNKPPLAAGGEVFCCAPLVLLSGPVGRVCVFSEECGVRTGLIVEMEKKRKKLAVLHSASSRFLFV